MIVLSKRVQVSELPPIFIHPQRTRAYSGGWTSVEPTSMSCRSEPLDSSTE
jgi:hypothetical protein